MIYLEFMENFPTFLLRKLQDYENEQGRRVTYTEFAEYLGVKRSILSHWMSGRYRPSIETAPILAEKLGPEVYTVLGFAPVDPDLRYITHHWDQLTEEQKHVIRETIAQYLTKKEK